VPSRKSQRFVAAEWQTSIELLAQVPVVHVAFVGDGVPRVMPIAAAADDDAVLLHGSTGSRWLRSIGTGIPVSVAVTATDGLVVARSAFESSMHYRSAVLFGHCSPVADGDKERALEVLTEALIPGRVAEVRSPLPRELAATLVLRMTVDDFSVKVSKGWPADPPDDVEGPAWAGVLPVVTGYREALPAPDLRDGIGLPESVRGLLSAGSRLA
jgi:hypothetical protein